MENVAGMAFLLAADRVQTGSYIGLDYIIGDTGISQGRYVKKRKEKKPEDFYTFLLCRSCQKQSHMDAH